MITPQMREMFTSNKCVVYAVELLVIALCSLINYYLGFWLLYLFVTTILRGLLEIPVLVTTRSLFIDTAIFFLIALH